MFESMQEHGPATIELALPDAPDPAGWLEEARATLPGPGTYLAYRDREEIHLFPIEEGWTRIGRSAAADIRLDHPSVSRRHALIVLEEPKAMRVLDDRSLNGVFVNGEEIDWSRLSDGDVLAIGRFRLVALEA